MAVTIYVKTLDDRTHKFEIRNDTTVRQLKARIGRKTRINPQKQRVLYMGRELTNSTILSSLGLNNQTLHVVDKYPPHIAENRPDQYTHQSGQNRRRFTISEQTLDYLINDDRLWMEYQRYSELDLLFRNQIIQNDPTLNPDIPLAAPIELLALDDLLNRIASISPLNEEMPNINTGQNQNDLIPSVPMNTTTENVNKPPAPKRGFFASLWYFFDGLNPF